MIPLGILFMFAPLFYMGINSEILIVWMSSVIGAKWFIFGIIDWYTNSKTGQKIVTRFLLKEQ